MNPSPNKAEHSLKLNEDLATPSVDLVLETADYYRIRAPRSNEIHDELTAAVRLWPATARAAGIGNNELDLMAPAFEFATAT